MKILIGIGLFIVFVSAFFIFLTGDTIAKSAFDCADENGKQICTYKGLNPTSGLSVFIIAFFIMIDIVTVYMVVTNLS